MTIEELWKDLKPVLNDIQDKVGNLENRVEKLEPLVGKVEKLEPLVGKVEKLEPLVEKVEKLEPLVGKVEKLEPLVGKVEKLEPLVEKVEKLEPLLEETKAIKEYMREIQHVNMTSLIKGQIEIKQELKTTEKRLTQKIDKYLQKNEVEHKKFEYGIAKLEWKNETID